MNTNNQKRIFGFVDAANLFYGGVKSLGWKIDYQKLLTYLKEKYGVSKVFYYAGVEIYDFSYSVLNDEPIDLKELFRFLENKLEQQKDRMAEYKIFVLGKNIARIKFYLKLKHFGYILKLKPTKIYPSEEGPPKKKANCDVDMTFDLMKMQNEFDKAIILSGDGDFAILLKYLKAIDREIIILSRNERTAKEIKRIARGDFRDFHRLRHKIEFFENKSKREGPAKDPPHV